MWAVRSVSPASVNESLTVPEIPNVAVPFDTVGLLRVATIVSVPSIEESSIAATVKENAPVPVPPLKVLSKVSVSTPSNDTPVVEAAAVAIAFTKLS